jgi:hypothetical protein
VNRVFWLLIAILLFAVIHEGAHAVTALFFGEFSAFHVRPYGFEVTYLTPVAERSGWPWAVMSGVSNLVTILVGMPLLAARQRMASSSRTAVRKLGFWATALFMLGDPFNLGIGPFLYNGDAMGIAVGLGVSPYAVQGVAFAILVLNRELIVRALLPAYGVSTSHPLFWSVSWRRERG